MPEILTAPAPAGVQTHDKPPQEPLKVKAGDKFRAEFEKLQKAESTPPAPTEESVKPKEFRVTTPTDEAPKETLPADAAPTVKPESPLDAVLATEPNKEPEPVAEPDVLKEFDEVNPDWKRARGVMKTQSEKIRELEGKVTEIAKAPKAEPSVVEALTKERDEIRAAYQQQEEKLKAINYQYSDEYQGLLKARDNSISKISNRVKAYGGDAEALVAALSLPDGKVKTAQIKEALADVDTEDKPRIHALIETFEEHNEKIIDASTNAAPKWDELQAQRNGQLEAQSAAQLKQLDTEFGKVAEELPALSAMFRQVSDDVPGGTEWNQEIKEAIEGGLKVLKPDGADFKQSAIIAAKGIRYDTLEKRYLSLHSDHVALKKQYTELAGSGPDFRGGTKPDTKVDKKPGAKYREALALAQTGGLGEV